MNENFPLLADLGDIDDYIYADVEPTVSERLNAARQGCAGSAPLPQRGTRHAPLRQAPRRPFCAGHPAQKGRLFL